MNLIEVLSMTFLFCALSVQSEGQLADTDSAPSIEQLDSDEIKLNKSEFTSDTRKKRQAGLAGGITSIHESQVCLILNEVLSEGDYQTYRLIRIIESSHQTVQGSLYRIKAIFLIDYSTKTCNVEILDQPWLGKSARKVKFECNAGTKPISDTEQQNLLNEVLAEGYQSYRLIRIIESSYHADPAFMYYRIKAEFSVEHSTRTCTVQIWDRPGLGKSARQVEFKCDVATTSISGTDVQIQNLINEVIAEGYQTYRLIRIIESSHQGVQEFLYYRIKAEFVVEHITRTCFMEIWDRPWLAKSVRQVVFKCNAGKNDDYHLYSNSLARAKRDVLLRRRINL